MTVERRVFLSYRREESSWPANWLYERLVQRFGDERVFMDVVSLQKGDNFAEVIIKAVRSSSILLALIGDR